MVKEISNQVKKHILKVSKTKQGWLIHHFIFCVIGVNVLPEAALLVFVWETLAMYQGADSQKFTVAFKNIQFHNEIIVTAEMLVRLTVMISKGSNNFEVRILIYVCRFCKSIIPKEVEYFFFTSKSCDWLIYFLGMVSLYIRLTI